ncbi:MAG: hypothetical protein CVU04_04705 [Bacteroidetes bacterium HGW-Bacteroidetes-20]|nr:MAG: hypothetical protein CVU04_04705 [Bacteroidetes bacterium HGW-Bacteroidetes-20]
MEEYEIIETAATHGANWMMILSMVMNFIFGGTTLFGLIKWRSERKLRDIDQKKEEKNLDVQNFDALVKQIEYQEELLEKYIVNKKKSEELEDERDRLIIEMKRNQTNLELEKISLQKKLTIAESLVCKNSQCKERQS